MKFVLHFILLMALLSCGKTPKPTPIINNPIIDTPIQDTRIFKGEYIMYDSSVCVGSSTYPPYSREDHFTVNKTANIEIDSIKKQLVFNKEIFSLDSFYKIRYSKEYAGPPIYWEASEDTAVFAVWTQLPNHMSSWAYVKGYRRK